MKKYKTSDEEFLNDNDITDQDTDDKINYALAFKSHLQKIGTYFQSTDEGECILFFFVMPVLNAPCINLNVRVYPEGYVNIFCKLVTEVSYPQRALIRDVLNKLCRKFRYIRLFMGEDNDVIATYDFFVVGDVETANRHILNMINNVGSRMGTMDRSIPYIMTKLWGTVGELE